MSAPAPGTTERCSQIWDATELPAWGTAPAARFWVLLEQRGAWGRVAATDSDLDPGLGAELDAACAERGGRLALIRAVHKTPPGPVRVLIAGGLGTGDDPQVPWLGGISLDSPSDLGPLLTTLDTDAAEPPTPLTPTAPVLAVCTNGTRDICCATRGRALARQVASAAQQAGFGDDRVWEVSHLGGHRFSPTALLLPTAQMLGRLDPAAALSALISADRGALAMPGVEYERGRTHLAPRAQVAEIATRYRYGLDTPAGVRVTTGETDRVEVSGSGFAEHRQVGSVPAGAWPTSCGKPPEPASSWVLSEVSDE